MNHFKLLAVAAAALALLPLASAPTLAADTYKLDKAHTTIGFTIMRQGYNRLVGGFREFGGTITFDEQNPVNSKVSVDIKTSSFYSGWAARDKHLRSPAFFNAAEIPNMKFVSRKVEKTGAKTGKITGNLTLLGVTKPVTLDVKFNRKGERKGKTYSGFSATGSLDRTDWGMNFLAKFVGPKVDINLEVLAVKQ